MPNETRSRSGEPPSANGASARTARLLISCPDRQGVVARVAGFLADEGANILDADQHTDPASRSFFMRVEFEGGPEVADRSAFESRFGPLADDLGLKWEVRWPGRVKRIAILAGPSTHCVSDLLWRFDSGELAGEVTRVVSNHTASARFAEQFGRAFDHEEVRKGAEAEQEAAVRAILEADDAQDGGLDLIILARYMRVLSPAFVDRFAGRIINIHHSFLPAFQGARPYHRAFDRGVKLIGATSHYVTADLDEGPIIAQDVVRVSHRDTIEDLVRKGRDLERVVLAEAVRAHLDDRVLVHGPRTIVFD